MEENKDLAQELSSLIRSSRPFHAALTRAIAQDDAQQLRNAADHLISAAARGEPWAISALADRLDGKPKQQTELSGDLTLRGLPEVLESLGRGE
jgi:HPt (histidine-containing phosphotransfer) domain-containing protein